MKNEKNSGMIHGDRWEEKHRKYAQKPGIKCERANFLFLKDSTMVIDSELFDGSWDALIDAVMNRGEDPDDMIALIFPEKIDHEPVRRKLTQAIQEIKDKKEKEEKDLMDFMKMCLETSPSGLVNICGGDCIHCVKYMKHKRIMDRKLKKLCQDKILDIKTADLDMTLDDLLDMLQAAKQAGYGRYKINLSVPDSYVPVTGRAVYDVENIDIDHVCKCITFESKDNI